MLCATGLLIWGKRRLHSHGPAAVIRVVGPGDLLRRPTLPHGALGTRRGGEVHPIHVLRQPELVGGAAVELPQGAAPRAAAAGSDDGGGAGGAPRVATGVVRGAAVDLDVVSAQGLGVDGRGAGDAADGVGGCRAVVGVRLVFGGNGGVIRR